MTIVDLLCLVFVVATVVAVFYWPEVGLACQLFGSPIFVIAFNAVGASSGIFYAVFLLSIASGLRRRSEGVPFIVPCTAIELLTILLVGVMALSLVFTRTPSYGLEKVLLSCGMALPILWLSRYFSMTPYSAMRTLRVMACYGIGTVSVLLVILILSKREVRFSAGFNPLVVGYTAVAAIAMAYYLFASTESRIFHLLGIFGILSGTTVVLATGSRGPVLALLVGFLLTHIRGNRVARSLRAILAIAIFFLGLGLFQDDVSVGRVLGKTEDTQMTNGVRIRFLQKSLKIFSENVSFGGGIGSFAFYDLGHDERHYPHNIFAEISAETGVAGLTVLISILALAFRHVLGLRRLYDRNALADVIQIIFWIGMVNASLSFDFPFQRALFLGLGLLAGSGLWSDQSASRYLRYPANTECSGATAMKPTDLELLVRRSAQFEVLPKNL